jgi:hypothetical protein
MDCAGSMPFPAPAAAKSPRFFLEYDAPRHESGEISLENVFPGGAVKSDAIASVIWGECAIFKGVFGGGLRLPMVPKTGRKANSDNLPNWE